MRLGILAKSLAVRVGAAAAARERATRGNMDLLGGQ